MTPGRRGVVRRMIGLFGLAALATRAGAQGAGVALAGRMGDKALLMIDGQPRTLAIGQAAGDVRLLRWDGEAAVVERGRERLVLRVGASPQRVGGGSNSGSSGREIVLTAGPGGHFISAGSINGRSTRFMVDTGATQVSLSRDEAARLGIDLRGARSGLASTANGTVPVLGVTLTSVRLGDVAVANVEATVLPLPMPYVLLGNSFLTRFQMRRENDVMRLELR
jgi:aspartyl protease family protein